VPIDRYLVAFLLVTATACGAPDGASVDASLGVPPDATARTQAAPGPRHDEIMAAIKALTDRHACNRVTGCPGLVGLFQYGPDLIAPAAEALARPDRGDGHWSILLPEVLGQLADPRATTPLVTLLGDRRWEIRIAAAIGLAHLGDTAEPSALAELTRLAALPDNEPGAGGDLGFRAALELALMRIDTAHAKQHRTTLVSLIPSERERVLAVPPPVLDVLVAIIGHGRLSECLPAVRGGLATGNRFVVATSLDVAGRLQDNGAIIQILPLLEDQNPTLRKLAFGALSQITGASFDSARQWRDWATRVGIVQ